MEKERASPSAWHDKWSSPPRQDVVNEPPGSQVISVKHERGCEQQSDVSGSDDWRRHHGSVHAVGACACGRGDDCPPGQPGKYVGW